MKIYAELIGNYKNIGIKSLMGNKLAVDLKIQSEKGRREDFVPEFIILEINSAPSIASVTEVKYREELPKIINDKIANYGRS